MDMFSFLNIVCSASVFLRRIYCYMAPAIENLAVFGRRRHKSVHIPRFSSSQKFLILKSPSLHGVWNHFHWRSIRPLYAPADMNLSFYNIFFSCILSEKSWSFGMTLEYGRQSVAKHGIPIAEHSMYLIKLLQ